MISLLGSYMEKFDQDNRSDDSQFSGVLLTGLLLLVPVATILIYFGRYDLFAWLLIAPFLLLGLAAVILSVVLIVKLLFGIPDAKLPD